MTMTVDPAFWDVELESWREVAACHDRRDVDFFPATDDPAGIATAKALCGSCPVVEECLVFALETDQPDGIWGGLSARERKRLRRHLATDAEAS